jgi:hypothetical protein
MCNFLEKKLLNIRMHQLEVRNAQIFLRYMDRTALGCSCTESFCDDLGRGALVEAAGAGAHVADFHVRPRQ